MSLLAFRTHAAASSPMVLPNSLAIDSNSDWSLKIERPSCLVKDSLMGDLLCFLQSFIGNPKPFLETLPVSKPECIGLYATCPTVSFAPGYYRTRSYAQAYYTSADLQCDQNPPATSIHLDSNCKLLHE